MAVLEVDGLRKAYGTVVALDGCSLTARKGRLLGLLGPNGAGKTTLMRAVLGLVRPDGGTLRWQGRLLEAADRDQFGYMPEERGLYPSMRVAEQVQHFAALGGLSRAAARVAAAAVLERVGLTELADRRLLQLSHGNQQRAQLAVALVGDPRLLVLDEPFAGLDPLGVATFGGLLRDLAAEGRTVVFSSHQLDLVEDLCEDIVILAAGRVVLAGTLADIRAESVHRFVEVRLGRPPEASAGGPGWWREVPGVRPVPAGNGLERLVVERDVDLERVLRAARSAGEVQYFAYTPPSLEELFREAVSGGRS